MPAGDGRAYAWPQLGQEWSWCFCSPGCGEFSDAPPPLHPVRKLKLPPLAAAAEHGRRKPHTIIARRTTARQCEDEEQDGSGIDVELVISLVSLDSSRAPTASLRLATVEVTSVVTSSLTQQICLCGNELMRRDVVLVT